MKVQKSSDTASNGSFTHQYAFHSASTYSTSIVQFNGSLALLGRIVKAVPAKLETSIAVVTGELGTAHVILHDAAFEESNEEHGAVNLSLEMEVSRNGVP